jgi:hypothetical protein
MKTKIIYITTMSALLPGIVATAWGDDNADQSEFPQVIAQPIDQGMSAGSNAVFTVQATNADGYQWQLNGVAMDGQTNGSLILQNVGVGDVGLYSCAVSKGIQSVPTRAASLSVLAADTGGGMIILYGAPLTTPGSLGSCPGSYAGYVSYTKTASQGWGWAPSSGTTVHTASDTNRADTKIVYGGKYSDTGCAQTSVTLPSSPPSPKYRFTIYFPNSVPTNAYPITLTGFDP